MCLERGELWDLIVHQFIFSLSLCPTTSRMKIGRLASLDILLCPPGITRAEETHLADPYGYDRL